jgi:hypothetical protein
VDYDNTATSVIGNFKLKLAINCKSDAINTALLRYYESRKLYAIETEDDRDVNNGML